MARTRDVVIGIIIAAAFLMALAVFAFMVIGMLSQTDELEFTGLSGGEVGIVEMFGIIDEQSARPVIRQLDRWAKSGSIKAIIVHIDSPGGVVAPSQELYDAIIRAKKEKPVVAAMASVAASGGYYVACAADRVIANPGTITGSIGVIFQFHTLKGLLDKVGVGTETIKSGELKDVGSYARPMTEKEQQMLQAVVSNTYEQFVEVVAAGRQKEKEEIYPLADGSIFTGLQAYNLGLVDTLGGLQQAIEVAAELADIQGEPNVVRPYKREKISLFDLMGQMAGKVNGQIDQAFSGPQLLYLYQ
ncbi:MAG: signal peptide peptidase SppA [Candidatus Zixiibacteriota bacterium]